MRTFYTNAPVCSAGPSGGRSAVDLDRASTYLCTRARIAVYDYSASAPRVEEVHAESVDRYIEAISARTYELSQTAGGVVPYTVVRELSENLIHAGFAEPVISIMDGGNTIRFADQGPGISDKQRAVLPGFTTASGEMKQFIRGVGSGLPIVSDFLRVSGGSLSIEDNLGSGAVVTVTASPSSSATPVIQPIRPTVAPRDEQPTLLSEPSTPPLRLTTRQKQVLALVMESGEAGPSIVSRELGVGLSTAYRDLASLEELGLISSVAGKRTLTSAGIDVLNDILRD